MKRFWSALNRMKITHTTPWNGPGYFSESALGTILSAIFDLNMATVISSWNCMAAVRNYKDIFFIAVMVFYLWLKTLKQSK